jgi:hypothetical protein
VRPYFYVYFSEYYTSYWTSGMRIDDTDNFIWSGTGQPVQGYTNWDNEYNEPDNDGNCILIEISSRKWWDYSCDYELGVICEE